jgi:hypothetical protein
VQVSAMSCLWPQVSEKTGHHLRGTSGKPKERRSLHGASFRSVFWSVTSWEWQGRKGGVSTESP